MAFARKYASRARPAAAPSRSPSRHRGVEGAGPGPVTSLASVPPTIQRKCAHCQAEDNREAAIQPRLEIGPVDDPYEREADRIADRVVSGEPGSAGEAVPATPLVQRQETTEEEDKLRTKALAGPRSLKPEDEEADVQMKPAAPGSLKADEGAAAAAGAVAAGGRPLSAGERGFFEPRFGRDFSGVRVHDDARAGAAARAIGARAFTLGEHVAFAPGHYDSASPGGRHLMAHELAHVVQQGGAPPRREAAASTAAPAAGPAAVPPGHFALRLMLPGGERRIGPDGGSGSDEDRDVPASMPAGRIGRRVQRRASFTMPTPTDQDPLARIGAGQTPGLTTPTINGNVVSTVTQLLTEISPTRVIGSTSGGTATCQFDPSFVIDTSANVIIASAAGATGWTGTLPTAVLGGAAACSGVPGPIPATMTATPSNADFVTRVRASEFEHVAGLREVHDRHLVPYDAFVMGLRGTGPTLNDCAQNLAAQLGHRATQAAYGFNLGHLAETERLDGPGGTHEDSAVPTIAAGCTSVALLVGQTNPTIPGSSRGNVVTVAPTVTTYDAARLAVSGNNVVETPATPGAGAPRVIHSFSSAANATVGLHVFQHYGTTSKNVIGAMTYLLVGAAAPPGSSAALNGVTEEAIDPARFQVSFGVPTATDWAITQIDGNNIRTIVVFGAARNEAYSAVDVLRGLGVTRIGRVGPRASPELMFFRL